MADEIQGDLANWNVDTTSVSFVDIYNSRKRRYDAAYTYHISARTGLLLVSEAFRERDTHPAARQFRPSETAWQSFLRIVSLDGVRPSKLRCIVLGFVVNENTKAIIFKAGRRSTSTFQKTLGYKEYTDLDDGCYALLGSALGKMMVNMILDHKVEIGCRSVDRVVLRQSMGPNEELPHCVIRATGTKESSIRATSFSREEYQTKEDERILMSDAMSQHRLAF